MPFQEISKEEQRASRDVHIYYDDNTRTFAKAVAESAAEMYPDFELHWLECTRMSETPGRGAYQNRKLGVMRNGTVQAIAKVSTKGAIGWISHEPFHWTIAEGPVKPTPKVAGEGDPCQAGECDGFLGHAPVENCSCHISPPCSACVDNPLVCLSCGMIHE